MKFPEYNHEFIKSLSFSEFLKRNDVHNNASKEQCMEIYTAITGKEAKEDEEPVKETKPTKK